MARQYSTTLRSKFTCAQWFKQWLDERKGIKVSTRTIYAWQFAKNWNPRLGAMLLSDVRPAHILKALGGRELMASSLRLMIAPAKKAFSAAKGLGEINDNPFTDLDLSPIMDKAEVSTYEVDPFTATEKVKLYEACLVEYPLMAEMLKFWMWSGLRAAELCALRWPDVNVKKELVSISHALVLHPNYVYLDNEGAKTKLSVRTFRLTPPALEALEAQRRHTFFKDGGKGYIFPNPTSAERWKSPGRPAYFFAVLCAETGVRYRNPEQCRHTFATTMLDNKEDRRWIADSLGHKDIGMLIEIYGRKRVLDEAQPGGYQFAHTGAWV
jgi:integrase